MNIRQRKAERHKETLRKLSQEGGNRYCFDCDMRGPLYVVSDFNILVCSGCSAVHRSFQHKVKGITMSEFTEEELARFMLGGNDTAEKVWLSTFRGKHPRSGDVLAVKDFVKDIFVDRRYCDQVAYASLLKSWEDPVAALAAAASSPPPAAAAAHTTLPPPPAPMEARSPAPAESPAEPQKEAPAAPVSAAAAPSAQPAPNNVFDDLFAAPVAAPTMSPPPPAPVAPPPPPPKVTSLVDDLFAGAPAPLPTTSAPTSGFSSASPQPCYSTFAGAGGVPYPVPQAPSMSAFNSNELFSSGAPIPPQQQQPQFYNFSAPLPQTAYANPQNAYGNYGPPASYMPPMQQQQPQQQQQYPGYSGGFNAPLMQPQGPFPDYSSAAQPPFPGQQQQHPHAMDFNPPAPPQHITHANDPFKSLGDPSVFAHLGGGGGASGVAPLQSSGSGPTPALPTPSQNAPSSASNPWSQPAPAQAPPLAWNEPMPLLQQLQQPPTSSPGFSGTPQSSAQGQGWGSPASNAPSSPNRSRIKVLSVTKSSEPPSDTTPMWH